MKLAIGMEGERVVVDGPPMFDWASYLQFIDCRTQQPSDKHYTNPNLNPREWNQLINWSRNMNVRQYCLNFEHKSATC